MKLSTMVHNANQIALFFATYPHEEAVAGVANHISKYWEPRMRGQIQQYVAEDGGRGLHPLVLEALAHLRVEASREAARVPPRPYLVPRVSEEPPA